MIFSKLASSLIRSNLINSPSRHAYRIWRLKTRRNPIWIIYCSDYRGYYPSSNTYNRHCKRISVIA